MAILIAGNAKPPEDNDYQPAHPRGGGVTYGGFTRRKPGGNADAAARREQNKYDPGGAIGSTMSQIAAEYDAERDAILNEFGRSYGGGGGGGGGAGYADAIREAQELLNDVIANRAELGKVYDEYNAFLDPYSDEAIQQAAAIVKQNEGAFDAIEKGGKAGIEKSYNAAESAVRDAAALIKAGKSANDLVVKDIDGEGLRIANEIAEAMVAKDLLNREQKAALTEAQAERALDEGAVGRERKLLDMEFEEMEEAAREQLKALREAAAGAASAGSARRASMAASQAAMLGELNAEKYASMRLNPHEAGEVTALNYLRNNASGLDYNRQQLVLSTMSNAISTQVRPSNVGRWAREMGIALSADELRHVQNGVSAYQAGMRYQQRSDSGGGSGSTSGSGRAPAYRPRNTR